MAGLNVLTREAMVQTQLPPSLRAVVQGMHMVGMAGAPVIVGDTPRTPAERQAAHHGLPVPGRGYVAPIIVGTGAPGGHHHHRGRRGIAFIGPGWWNQPYYPQYVPVPAAPDCQQVAAQAAQDWARFGVTQVYCGSSTTGAPSLVAVSTTPDAARRGIPPVYMGMRTSVQ